LKRTGWQSAETSKRPFALMSDSGAEPRRRAKPPASTSASPGEDPPVEHPEPEIIDEAVEYLRPLLRDPANAKQAAQRVFTKVQMFRGPLPHPQHLQEYENIAPGIAKAIVDNSTKEQAHRHKMQTLEMVYPYLGWFAGFVSFLTCIVLATILGLHGREWLACAFLGVPCIGAVGWFINSRISPHGDDIPTNHAKERTKPQVKKVR